MMSCVILMWVLFCCCCFFFSYCKFSEEPWYNSQKRGNISKPPFASTLEEEITGLLIRLSAFCLILRASCSNWLLYRRTLRGWSFITCGGGGGLVRRLFAGDSFQNFVWLWGSFSNNRSLTSVVGGGGGGWGHFNKFHEKGQSSNEQELKVNVTAVNS